MTSQPQEGEDQKKACGFIKKWAVTWRIKGAGKGDWQNAAYRKV